MHIPNSMLQGTICPVTAIISTLGVIVAAISAIRSENKPTAARFGAITAFIFAGQMMNFPIQNGTSGHLLGGVLAAALLGVPFGVLAMALVVVIQCVVFSDGGFSVLGANVLNMALVGAGLGGILKSVFLKDPFMKNGRDTVKLGLIAWFSVMLATFACSLELAFAGTIAFSKVAVAMFGTHALIGIGEAVITIAACFAFSREKVNVSEKRLVYVPLVAAGVIAMMLSPFASGFPDGLEWVAQKYRFLHEAAPSFTSPLTDYAVPSVGNEAISTGLAGLTGIVIAFFAAWGIARILNMLSQTKNSAIEMSRG
ncbi:MAG: energy-coupling factor ABC transporter permease [Candidatus Omnitrophota bacterium]